MPFIIFVNLFKKVMFKLVKKKDLNIKYKKSTMSEFAIVSNRPLQLCIKLFNVVSLDMLFNALIIESTLLSAFSFCVFEYKQ